MTKYRTRQIEVEARQILELGHEAANAETIAWCGATATDSHIEGKLFHVPVGPRPITSTRTPPATTVARVGDWVVKTTDDFAVLTDEAFRARYEEIKAEPAKAAAKATVAPAAEAKP